MESVILTAHKLRVRRGQPGFVVIESKDREPRVSFLFTASEAIDMADEMRLIAIGAREV